MLSPSLITPAFLLVVVASCGGGASADYAINAEGMSATSGDFGVSGGGYRLARGEEPFLYGTVLEHEKRSYTYLVLIRGEDPLHDGFDIGSAGSSEVGDGRVSSDHVLTLGDDSIQMQYRARIDPELNKLVDRKLTVQGVESEADAGWLFLFDLEAPDARLKAIDMALPELPTGLDQVAGFTSTYVADLARTTPEIDAFLNR